MGFQETFSRHFDHPAPFPIPPNATDGGDHVVTDPASFSEDFLGVLGAGAFTKLPAGSFLYAAVQDAKPNVTFFLMIIDGERYFYFREAVRDVFNANASPEACYKTLTKIYGIFTSRKETAFKLVYAHGKLQVNNKVLGA